MKSSVVTYRKLNEHDDWRWDSEYLCFEPRRNKRYVYKPIGDVLTFSQYGISIDMNEEGRGYKIYRMNEISNMFCDRGINKYADILTEEVKKFKLKNNDVLFNRTNSQKFVGRTGIFKKFFNEDIVFASYLIRVRTKEDEILPEYLTTFLNTKYGIQDAKRRARISINQSNINAEELKRVKIPIIQKGIQEQIRNIFNKSFNLINKSSKCYSQAESMLLSELNLSNLRFIHRLSFVKNFADTQSAGRIDAEYFQPKYEDIEKRLSDYEQKSLDSLCSLINYGTVPTSPYCEVGVPYIKGLNLVNGFISGQLDKIKNTDRLSKKFYAKENDIIISQMGTVGKAAIVTKSEQDYLFASFTIRVRLKDYDYIDPYVLTLYINKVAREWYLLRKIAQASVRQNTDLPTITALKVPKINVKVQQQIRNAIQTSQNSKIASKQLLDIAMYGVELAIEKDEKIAQEWITEKLKSFRINSTVN